MIRALFKTLVIASSLLAGTAQAITIEVFTHHPSKVKQISGHQVRTHDLSAPDKVKGPRFSANATQAEKEAKAWLHSAAGQRHIQELRDAHKGHTQAIKYQLKKVPAVVFEGGKYVVYGTIDVRQALQDYHHRRNQRVP